MSEIQPVVRAGIEPGILDTKSGVLTTRLWCLAATVPRGHAQLTYESTNEEIYALVTFMLQAQFVVAGFLDIVSRLRFSAIV